MILKPLSDVHPTVNWNDPQMKSSSLGYCAAEYYKVTQFIEANFKIFPQSYTLITNMHLSLELATKAIAVKLVPGFNSKRFGHKTSTIISTFFNQISVFGVIKNNIDEMLLIQELENGFIDMRYGEVYCMIDQPDRVNHRQIFLRLIDFLHSITRNKFIPQHFK